MALPSGWEGSRGLHHVEDVVRSCCYGQQCEVGRGLRPLHLRADGVSSVWWGGGRGWQVGLPGALTSHFWLNLHPSISRVPTRGKKNSKPPSQRAVFPQFSHLPICLSVICLCVCPPTTHFFLFPSSLTNGSSARSRERSRAWLVGPSRDAPGTQREEPPGRGHSSRVPTTWRDCTHWRSRSLIHAFRTPLELLLDSGTMSGVGAMEVSQAAALPAPRGT